MGRPSSSSPSTARARGISARLAPAPAARVVVGDHTVTRPSRRAYFERLQRRHCEACLSRCPVLQSSGAPLSSNPAAVPELGMRLATRGPDDSQPARPVGVLVCHKLPPRRESPSTAPSCRRWRRALRRGAESTPTTRCCRFEEKAWGDHKPYDILRHRRRRQHLQCSSTRAAGRKYRDFRAKARRLDRATTKAIVTVCDTSTSATSAATLPELRSQAQR